MSAAATPKKRRHWLRRLVVWLVVGGVVGFFGSNLVIGSSWGRAKIAGKLRGMSGFQWSVGRASWSPWGGVGVGGLEMLVPGGDGSELGPVLVVDEVRVRPYWGSLMTGTLQPREVVVENPVGDVPLELLAALMQAQRPVQVVQAEQKEPGGGSEDVVEPETGSEEFVEERAVAPEVAPEQVAGQKEESLVEAGPAGRLLVRGGRMRVFSHGAPQWSVELVGCEAELPIAGPEARGWVSVEEVRVGEQVLAGAWRSEVDWKKPVLSCPEMELALGGVPLRARVELLVGKRPRMWAQVSVPSVELTPLDLPGMGGVQIAANRMEAIGRFQGELARPSSWRGNFVGVVAGLSADTLGRVLVGFEEGRVAVNLQGGVLHLVDARLVGEQFSVLGNGGLRWDGRVVGVVRLVGDWEHAEALRRVAGGALLWNKNGWMRSMETPDRYSRDIHVEGVLGKAMVDLGNEAGGMELAQVCSQVQRFLAGEKVEEERGVPASPGWGPMLLQK